ncbi:MAG: hypothetical protein R2729_24920 [Bryobacteraceae bacterium]
MRFEDVRFFAEDEVDLRALDDFDVDFFAGAFFAVDLLVAVRRLLLLRVELFLLAGAALVDAKAALSNTIAKSRLTTRYIRSRSV